MAGLTIGKLAATEGVGVETVRFYQRRGLLPLPDRAGSGFREYTEDDQRRLALRVAPARRVALPWFGRLRVLPDRRGHLRQQPAPLARQVAYRVGALDVLRERGIIRTLHRRGSVVLS